MNDSPPSVLQLRVVIEADDFDDALAFYRDALGLSETAAFATGGDDRVAILEVGRATLELATPTHKRAIDLVETGGTVVAPQVRLAFEVTDARGLTRRLAGAGATVLADPVETPWRSLNSRLDAPAGQQITLFEELDPTSTRHALPGFGTAEDARPVT